MIHSPSRTIGVLLGILAASAIGYVLYAGGKVGLITANQKNLLLGLGVFSLIASAVFLTLRYPIDWWWFKKNPPKLNDSVMRLVQKLNPFFSRLSDEEKSKFADRLALFNLNKEIELLGKDEVPEDISAILGSHLVQITFYMPEDHFLEHLEKIILYPLYFPTIEQRQLHACEYHSDGVVIMGLKPVTESIIKPNTHINIPLYSFAEAFLDKNPDSYNQIVLGTEGIDFHVMRQIPYQQMHHQLKASKYNMPALWTEAFFVMPLAIKKALPSVYKTLHDVYNKNSLNSY